MQRSRKQVKLNAWQEIGYTVLLILLAFSGLFDLMRYSKTLARTITNRNTTHTLKYTLEATDTGTTTKQYTVLSHFVIPFSFIVSKP
jgi:hypothetical protein